MSQFQLGLHLIYFFCIISFSLITFSFSVFSFANLRCNNSGGGPADFGEPADSPAAAAGELEAYQLVAEVPEIRRSMSPLTHQTLASWSISTRRVFSWPAGR
jgi:hypothetical protein